jgi:hypothetical protein
LKVTTAAGKNSFLQVPLEVGTYDWTRFGLNVTIPKDAKSMVLLLGLESVSGTVEFDNVTLEKAE